MQKTVYFYRSTQQIFNPKWTLIFQTHICTRVDWNLKNEGAIGITQAGIKFIKKSSFLSWIWPKSQEITKTHSTCSELTLCETTNLEYEDTNTVLHCLGREVVRRHDFTPFRYLRERPRHNLCWIPRQKQPYGQNRIDVSSVPRQSLKVTNFVWKLNVQNSSKFDENWCVPVFCAAGFR